MTSPVLDLRPRQMRLHLYRVNPTKIPVRFVASVATTPNYLPVDMSGWTFWRLSFAAHRGAEVAEFSVDTSEAAAGRIYLDVTNLITLAEMEDRGVWDLHACPPGRTISQALFTGQYTIMDNVTDSRLELS